MHEKCEKKERGEKRERREENQTRHTAHTHSSTTPHTQQPFTVQQGHIQPHVRLEIEKHLTAILLFQLLFRPFCYYFKMVLYLIGLGLGDETDITVRGLECVRKCSRVYLEYYTSILGVDKAALEAYYGVSIVAADRYMVESEAEQMYQDAVTQDIAFLVVGDPLCATTHTDLILRARKIGAKVETIHNASVMAAVAGCGLQVWLGYVLYVLLSPF